MRHHRRLALALVLISSFTLVGCGKKAPTPEATPAPTPAAAPEQAATPAPTAAPEQAVADDEQAEPAPGADEAPSGDEAAPGDDEAVVTGDDEEEALADGGEAPVAPAEEAIAAANAALAPGPRAKAFCAKQAECGCSDDGCEAQIAEFERAVPETAWTCIVNEGCETFCAGQAVANCLAPVRDAYEANLRGNRIDRYCARHVQCGCPIAGCRDNLSKVDQAEVIEYAGCAARLECAAACEEGRQEVTEGMVAYDLCLAPILARMKTMHRLNMSAIRAMNNEQKRVYDENGNFLYTE